MTTTSNGSAGVPGSLWSARRGDFTVQQPKLIALYESVLEELSIDAGTRLLDVGCGAGLFMRLAAQRGAAVTGIDAAEDFVDIARERLREADIAVGEIETLPYEDDCFDVVTGFNAFQFAADPGGGLREAGRVATRGGAIVIATWGRPEQCEAAGYVKAVGRLLPPPPPGAPGPFALSDPAAIAEFAAGGDLIAGEHRDVLCVWDYAGEDELLTALRSTGFALRAIEAVGEERVSEAILEAVAPYRTSLGGYRLENVFSYLIAHPRGDH